jgi:hypothetical protein
MITSLVDPTLTEWSRHTADALRTRPVIDHKWFDFVEKLRSWQRDPESALIEDEDDPIGADVLTRAIEAALLLSARGIIAPTAVVPDCDGCILFVKQDQGLGASGQDWKHVTVRFCPGNRVEVCVTASDGTAEQTTFVE